MLKSHNALCFTGHRAGANIQHSMQCFFLKALISLLFLKNSIVTSLYVDDYHGYTPPTSTEALKKRQKNPNKRYLLLSVAPEHVKQHTAHSDRWYELRNVSVRPLKTSVRVTLFRAPFFKELKYKYNPCCMDSSGQLIQRSTQQLSEVVSMQFPCSAETDNEPLIGIRCGAAAPDRHRCREQSTRHWLLLAWVVLTWQ